MTMRATPDRADDGRSRIVNAGIRCLVREGIMGASMAAMAAEGGVSKALLHYHFADRVQLLATVALAIGERIVARERAMFEQSGPNGAVDVCWQWVDAELQRGELHVLLGLGALHDQRIQAAVAVTTAQRHAVAMHTVTRVFESLALVSRVPAALIAGASLALLDGLAMESPRDSQRQRASFDVFWLAVLGLGD